MNCTAARALLPEHALGVAGARETVAVERHVAWCAACRKESADLERAAVTLAYAPAPAEPAPGLEGTVVDAVRRVAAPNGTRGAYAGRARRTATTLLAAALVLAVMGGAVLATREPPAVPVVVAEKDKDSLDKFFTSVVNYGFADPDAEAALGSLMPPAEATAGETPAAGSALTIMAPSVDDQVMVIVTGLRPARRLMPYRVVLVDGRGDVVRVGRIGLLDAAGGATLARSLPDDLIGYRHVEVLDARSRLVLVGELEERTTLPSPSP